ncbi:MULTISPECIES: lysylphosphatidylglycerol synthase transmembrane domain-containing protein [unclassified Methanopyrus]|uniref:lysylphosphatidylglycerol synthase transmembrane domain-containing protein n=1 Tax=Methanopyrus sp. SNP6 TaxID=1937005 RepID=UPI00143C0659|nr:YbhN family protein [Methanopyrus sp. SNP6]
MERSLHIKTVLGAVAGAISLYITLFHLADVNGVLRTLQRADVAWILTAGACEVLWFAACVGGWKKTFEPLGSSPPRRQLFLIYCVKLMVNNLVSLARVLGDAVRVYYGVRLGWSAATVIPTIVADIVLGNAGYLAVILLGCVVIWCCTEVSPYLIAANGVGAAAVVGLWALFASERTCREAYESVRDLVEALVRRVGYSVGTVDELVDSTVRLFRSKEARSALVQYTVGWAARVLRLYCVTWAVWPTASPLIPLVMSIAIRGSAVVSVSPGGLGIVEGLTTGVLTVLGADPNRVMAALLLDRLYSFVIPVTLGAVSVPVLERHVCRG